MSRWTNPYDEGFVVFGAVRVLNGDVPYRDFWTQHAPGQFYLVALLFKVFGVSLLTERIWDASVRAGIMLLAFLTIRLWARPSHAFAGWTACGIWLAILGSPGFPLFPALLLCLLGVHFAIHYFRESQNPGFLCASGLCIGLAALFRHDLGFYAALGVTLAISAHVFAASHRPSRRGALLRALFPFGAGVALMFVPVALLLAMTVPIDDLVFSLFVVPATIYPSVRSLPFPSVAHIADAMLQGETLLPAISLVAYASIAAVAAGLWFWISLVRLASSNDRSRLEAAPLISSCLLLSLTVGLMYLKGLVRVSPLHLVQSTVPAIILLGSLAGRLRFGSVPARVAVLLAVVAMAIPTASAFFAIVANIERTVIATAIQDHPIWCRPAEGLERLGCFRAENRTDAMRYIVEHTTPGEVVYVGVGRHDKILINDVMFYFLTARKAPTKWHQLHPGVQTTEAVQARMIAEFRANMPRYIVLDSTWDSDNEPNQSAVSSGVTSFDRFLHNHYQPVASFGKIAILKAVAPLPQ
jgi:hypothetical protein